MDSASIDPDLICIICDDPLEDPYCTPCDHTFCYSCITPWITQGNLTCPTCRHQIVSNDHLKPASRTLRNILSRLHVRCTLCGQMELQKENFDNHLNNICLKNDVSCSASNVKCPWTGTRDQLDDHLANCIFTKFQSIFNDWNNEIKQLRALVDQQQMQINTLQIEEQNHKVVIARAHQRCHELEQKLEILQGKKLSSIQLRSEASSIRDDNALELQRSSMNGDFMSFVNDASLFTIRFLEDTSYRNRELEELIANNRPHSTINLAEQNLKDQDMQIVVQKALIEKQCKILELYHNQFSWFSSSILASALNNNKILKQLHLHDNRISDRGVQVLAQTLALNNCNLEILNLGDNKIGDDGARHLADMLKTNTKLTRLDLDENEISDVGAEALIYALFRDNNTIEQVYLDENQSIGDKSIHSLVNMIKHNRSLKRLGLGNCSFSNNGKRRLQTVANGKSNFTLDFENMPV